MTDFDPVKYLEGLPRESSITDGEVRRMYELGMDLREGATLVELGVWQGRSTVLLAMIADQRHGMLYAIDHFKHPGCSRAAVKDRLRVRGLDHAAFVLEQHTGLVELGHLRIDFLHVDADHTSPGIDQDCSRYVPMVGRKGIVCFDDYQQLATEPHYPDVKRVADNWCGNEGWENLGTVDGMGFFWKRP
jgi:predicted O-methyltransferase YrrM